MNNPGQQTLGLKQLINGQWVEGSGPAATSSNPALPEEAVAQYATATSGDLDRALNAATAAAAGWDRLGIIARGNILRRAAEILGRRAEEVAQLMTREQGKVLGDSRGEVGATIETLYYNAGSARRSNAAVYPSANPDEVVRTIRRPLGCVAVITPWNFPLQIPAWKIAPALLWGNTIVWKTASDTPATAVVFAEILEEAGVPAGVLNLLLGPGALGSELVADPRAEAVTFTGSVEVGHLIREKTVLRGAKLQMELGGHNAAIVLPDADLPSAADFITAAATGSTGQKCTATRRVIAVGAVHDQLRDELITRFNALSVGAGTEEGAGIGPVVNDRARRDIDEAVKQAETEGAQVLARAPIPDAEGHFVAPTLLGGTRELTICHEEVFGPVTTLLRADSLEEAIELANDTEFGLTASVFTSDERSIRRCLNDLVAGLIKVNGPSTGSEVHAPFGGLRDSSQPGPREQNSDAAADFFTLTKTAYLRLAPEGA
ncbi:Aldehyde dehydrogenase [Arthrobacter rhombi]|uniref:Aldehyde dehydrogenase n=1 Tax=Arthrobacter rhombi TaxID=71253 RepID=A0A1R4EXT6_9MICC|nr:Aldehyde dehydrogenase [Arthrobacter rhombi]